MTMMLMLKNAHIRHSYDEFADEIMKTQFCDYCWEKQMELLVYARVFEKDWLMQVEKQLTQGSSEALLRLSINDNRVHQALT